MMRFVLACRRARLVSLFGTLLLGVALVGAAALPFRSASAESPAASTEHATSRTSGTPTGPATDAAPDAAIARVKAALEPLVKGGRHRVEEVRSTPIPGIYEARIGTDLLVYVDAQGRYMFYDGALVEIQSQRNLTQERIEELQTIDFRTLPLDLAIKQVNGNGKRVVAVFEDPNCGYCKRLRADLVKLEDLTIYTFPVAILAADSASKANKALCAADKARAWNELMLNNRVPGNTGTCDTPLQQVRELAEKLGVHGTPTLFFSNGRRLTGYTPPDRFARMLSAYSKG